MALDQSALLDLLAELKLTDVPDRIRVATETLYQQLIDAGAAAFIGAAPFERSAERTTHRNGTRLRTLSTTAGDLELTIPKLRQGTFTPARCLHTSCSRGKTSLSGEGCGSHLIPRGNDGNMGVPA
jgi:putative transposase